MSRAMPKAHTFEVNVAWTGNIGEGTIDYASYERSHEISAEGKPAVPGSSDPAFRGDKSRYNPEELLVASLSTCHMLWYLHLCADAHVVVIAYADKAAGTLKLKEDGGGRFSEVILKPSVTIKKGCDPRLAEELHRRAHELCFIANSVNFAVRVEPTITVE
ncbi:MAG: peroxiredoxin [Acidobacteria bacterium]|nr:MAG: peroxiredoxin [Acidobacteriota bacterium]